MANETVVIALSFVGLFYTHACDDVSIRVTGEGRSAYIKKLLVISHPSTKISDPRPSEIIKSSWWHNGDNQHCGGRDKRTTD